MNGTRNVPVAGKMAGVLPSSFHNVACWFRYLNGHDEQGREIVMKDPMAARLRELAVAGGKDPDRLLAVREIFSGEQANSPQFTNLVKEMLNSFYEQGARDTGPSHF